MSDVIAGTTSGTPSGTKVGAGAAAALIGLFHREAQYFLYHVRIHVARLVSRLVQYPGEFLLGRRQKPILIIKLIQLEPVRHD